MVMDSYDTGHETVFNRTIPIYSNTDIDAVIELYASESDEHYSEELQELITNLRNSLKVLDYRYITSISGRLITPKPTGRKIWDNIVVYRGTHCDAIMKKYNYDELVVQVMKLLGLPENTTLTGEHLAQIIDLEQNDLLKNLRTAVMQEERDAYQTLLAENKIDLTKNVAVIVNQKLLGYYENVADAYDAGLDAQEKPFGICYVVDLRE